MVIPNSESHSTYPDADYNVTGTSDTLLLKTDCSFNGSGHTWLRFQLLTHCGSAALSHKYIHFPSFAVERIHLK